MRKMTAFSIAVLTLSTAALAQVGTTPGDAPLGNNTTAGAGDNSSGTNSSGIDNTTTPQDGTSGTPSNAQ